MTHLFTVILFSGNKVCGFWLFQFLTLSDTIGQKHCKALTMDPEFGTS